MLNLPLNVKPTPECYTLAPHRTFFKLLSDHTMGWSFIVVGEPAINFLELRCDLNYRMIYYKPGTRKGHSNETLGGGTRS